MSNNKSYNKYKGRKAELCYIVVIAISLFIGNATQRFPFINALNVVIIITSLIIYSIIKWLGQLF